MDISCIPLPCRFCGKVWDASITPDKYIDHLRIHYAVRICRKCSRKEGLLCILDSDCCHTCGEVYDVNYTTEIIHYIPSKIDETQLSFRYDLKDFNDLQFMQPPGEERRGSKLEDIIMQLEKNFVYVNATVTSEFNFCKIMWQIETGWNVEGEKAQNKEFCTPRKLKYCTYCTRFVAGSTHSHVPKKIEEDALLLLNLSG
jgi:hypothetical protein